ncbi:MAG TPA: ion transporter [Symbiobacteriaceae bacterium]|nr:ion transporter [Symbiobacteriaceae bacterium]
MTRDRMQIVMIILALLVIPLLIIEHQATDPGVLLFTWIANLLIWLAFVAEYVWGLVTAADRRQYLKEHWFDLAIIIFSPPFYLPESIQSVRSLRALRVLQIGRLGRVMRVLRLLRVFAFLARAFSSSRQLAGKHSFSYVIVASMLFVVGGGIIFVTVEGGDLSMLDGIWWAVATLTTVGYGDVYPKTDAGRVVALLIIVMGLGLMASLTANIAAYFVGNDQKDEQDEVLKRLDAIAERLDRLEQQVSQLQEKGVDR